MSRSVESKRVNRQLRARFQRQCLWVLVLVVGLWGIAIAASHARWGLVHTVAFDGQQYLDEGQLTQAAESVLDGRTWFVRHDRSWSMPRQLIAAEVAQVSGEIRDVAISHHQGVLLVSLELYEPHGLACFSEKECWFMTHDGIVYEPSPEFSLGVYPVIALETSPQSLPHVLEKEIQQIYHDFFITKRYDHLFVPTRIAPSLLDIRIDIRTIFGIRTEGYLLVDRVGTMGEEGVTYLADRLAALVDKTDIPGRIAEQPQNFEYLDMRFEDKLYVKFTPQDIAQDTQDAH